MKLSYLTFLTRHVSALAGFYVEALGLKEVLASRDERYREVKAGGVMLGFAHQDAYAALDMPDEANPTGTRALVSFALDRRDEVAPATQRARAAGATLVKGPFDTSFGQHLAVLRDPEGNIFRLTAPGVA